MYCNNCGVQIENIMKYCPECGNKQNKTANSLSSEDSLDYSLTEEILLEKQDKKEKVRGFNKQECKIKASAISKRFNSSLVLKIIGIILKIICLPLIPVFYVLGYFMSIVAGIGNIAVGIILFMAGIAFIISLFQYMTGKEALDDVIISIIVGVIFSVISLVINIIPAIFMGIAQTMIYFVFGINSNEE